MASLDIESDDGLKIIHAGLFRMGTWSMAKAYRILGFKTFHALDESDRVNWGLLEEAAEATWPLVPSARSRPPFTRSDWDRLWGNEYEVVCDTAAPFTIELFKAYPNSKVVLVQRDYNSWWPSFQTEIIDKLFTPFFDVAIFFAWHLVGYRAGHAMRKLLFGFFNAKSKEEIETHGRETYDKFYREIRSTVLAERLLEYKMGSGWGPLCEFLGKDIPNVPFPFSNDQKAHSVGVEARKRKVYLDMSRNAALSIMGFVAVGSSWWLLL